MDDLGQLEIYRRMRVERSEVTAMKKILIFLALSAPSWAAGICSVTSGPSPIGNTVVFTQGTAYMVTMICVGDASTGSFPATTIPGLIANPQLQGYVLSQVEIVPGGTAPTPGFSITITDSQGSDQLSGQATNLGATGTQTYAASATRTPISGTLTLNITGNSVASAVVSLVMYLTAPNITPYAGRAVVEKGTRWALINAPAAAAQATTSKAAVAGVRHVADCVTIALSAIAAPTATAVSVNLRDGATGAGTVIWTQTLAAPASTGNFATTSTCGLALIGSPNTAMTLEFSAGVASVSESVSLSGYDLE